MKTLLALSLLLCSTAWAKDEAICWACCARFEVKEIKGNTVIEKSPREGYTHPTLMCDFHSLDFGHGLSACNEPPETMRSINYKSNDGVLDSWKAK